MRRPSNIQIKKSLKIAYERIKSDYSEFICHALEDTPAEEYLKYFIHNAISGYTALGSWVWHNHIGIDQMFPSGEDMKAYRLRWIDYMLEGL